MKKEKYIRSENADFQRLQVLQTNRNKRYRYGEFLVEGVRNLNEARANGWKINSLIYAKDTALSDWARDMITDTVTDVNLVLTPELMRTLSGKTDTSELMATVAMRDPDELPLGENPFLLLFDRPSNRGNLGTVIRSADGFGADGLIITGHAVDLYDPETVAATMGSLFHLNVMRVAEMATVDNYIAELRKKYPSLTIVGTTSHSQKPLYHADLTRPTVMILGNETDGMSRHFHEIADELVTIPMADTSEASSFNVACAATVMMYEVSRQRSIL